MLRLLRAKRGKRHGFIRDRLLPTLGLNNENIHEQSAALHSQRLRMADLAVSASI
jgi:hypothetical protein